MSQNAVDMYTRSMVDMFDDRDVMEHHTGFLSFFGRPANMGKTLFSPDSNTVDIDIIRGNKKIAALIPRGINAKLIGLDSAQTKTQQYTNFSRVYPLAEQEGSIEATKLNDRRANENPYGGTVTKLDRLRLDAFEQHKEAVLRMTRLDELLASYSMINGEMPAILGTTDPDLIYDFRRSSTHTVTVSVKWDNASGDPDADLDDACDLIEDDGRLEADFALMGGTAMKAFMENATIKDLANSRRIELIEVSDKFPVPDEYSFMIKSGFKGRGRFQTSEGRTLWLFTYNGSYDDASGTSTRYLGKKQCFVGTIKARCDRYFGPSDVLPLTPSEAAWYQETFGFAPTSAPMPGNIKNQSAVILPESFHFDAYQDNARKNVTIRTQHAPIFAPVHTDAFVTLNAVVA